MSHWKFSEFFTVSVLRVSGIHFWKVRRMSDKRKGTKSPLSSGGVRVSSADWLIKARLGSTRCSRHSFSAVSAGCRKVQVARRICCKLRPCVQCLLSCISLVFCDEVGECLEMATHSSVSAHQRIFYFLYS